MLLETRHQLIYLYGLVPGRYLAILPVYIVANLPERLTFEVAVDDLERSKLLEPEGMPIAEGAEARREYITSTARVRLHQHTFPDRVIEAYRSQCALYRLRHRELLDAAHIVADVEEGRAPMVNSGISLCKLHLAVFDRFIIDTRPHARRMPLKNISLHSSAPRFLRNQVVSPISKMHSFTSSLLVILC